MNSPTSDGPVLPVLVFHPDGSLLGAAISNEKGYRKSIERNEAWLLDGNTGRLLPYSGISGFRQIVQRLGRYEIQAESFQEQQFHETVAASAESPSKNQPESDTIESREQQFAPFSALLPALEETIYERKQLMPEGSYTTHLFEKGEAKIRKKAGEEAVELLLAQSDEELASEAADFLYHFMVLLAQRDQSFVEVLKVLESRHN